jgi:hypothetical protein
MMILFMFLVYASVHKYRAFSVGHSSCWKMAATCGLIHRIAGWAFAGLFSCIWSRCSARRADTLTSKNSGFGSTI